MNYINSRKNTRVQVEMKIRSVSLPNYSADVVDLSNNGARVVLSGKPSGSLLEERIRFGLSLQNQMNSQFEGFARICWVKETENGLEAGLQWEKMSGSNWKRAEAVVNHVAA